MPERRWKAENESKNKLNGPKTLLAGALLLGLAMGGLTLNGEPLQEAVGSGVVTTEDRPGAEFHSIDSRSAIDVYVSQGPETAVRLEGEDNLLPLVITRVDKGVLVVDTRRGHFTVKSPLVVHVTMPEVRSLNVSGSGSVVTRTPLSGESLRLAVSGSGDLTVSGKFQKLDCEMTGSGDITVKGTALRQQVELEGSGTVNTQHLEATELCRSTTSSNSR